MANDTVQDNSDVRAAAPRATGTGGPARTRVVIVGAGFGGMEVAKALQGMSAAVTLLDRHNYTLFQPLLYQVATAALSPADVAAPIRAILHSRNVEMLLEEVVGVDLERACVRTASGSQIDYDILVLAIGSRFNYFGHDEWMHLAPAPKGLADAVEIRRRLLLAFERAEISEDEGERRALMTFVVVGAGATGVEMAGEIAELAKATLRGDFRRIDPAAARILLIEAGPHVLSGFPEKLRAYAEHALTNLGVELLLNTKVDDLDRDGVIAGGRRIAARTVIWGAGVRTDMAAWLGVPTGAQGAVKVNPDFSLQTHPNVFVIGDAADATDSDQKRLPGLAAVAKQEGQYVGKLLKRRLEGYQGSPPQFRYRDYGTMATIGRSAAVADLRGFQVTGTLAWLLWGLVHLYFLIGFRNRIVVLVNWFWAWLTYAHGARIITDSPARYAEGAEKFPAPRKSDELRT
jgi:NADH dehydrogenase